MTHDMKLGLAFAILSVGLVTAFWVKDVGVSSEALPQLLAPEAVVAESDAAPSPYPHAVADASTSIADEPWALPAFRPGGATAPEAGIAEAARPAEPRALPLEAFPELPPAFSFDAAPVAPSRTPRNVASGGEKRGQPVPTRSVTTGAGGVPALLASNGPVRLPEIPEFRGVPRTFEPQAVTIGRPEPLRDGPAELMRGRIEPWPRRPVDRPRPRAEPKFDPFDAGPSVALPATSGPLGRPSRPPFGVGPLPGHGNYAGDRSAAAAWNRAAKRDGLAAPRASGPRDAASAVWSAAPERPAKPVGQAPYLVRGCRPAS